jgi:hypothetical protein
MNTCVGSVLVTLYEGKGGGGFREDGASFCYLALHEKEILNNILARSLNIVVPMA